MIYPGSCHIYPNYSDRLVRANSEHPGFISYHSSSSLDIATGSQMDLLTFTPKEILSKEENF